MCGEVLHNGCCIFTVSRPTHLPVVRNSGVAITAVVECPAVEGSFKVLCNRKPAVAMKTRCVREQHDGKSSCRGVAEVMQSKLHTIG